MMDLQHQLLRNPGIVSLTKQLNEETKETWKEKSMENDSEDDV